MIDEATIETITSGGVGPLFDENPAATSSRVRPFVISMLLLRGAARTSEIAALMTPHLIRSDILLTSLDPGEDQTRLELLIGEVFGEFVAEGTLRFQAEKDLYVLTPEGMDKAIAWTCCLNAQLPDHLLTSF